MENREIKSLEDLKFFDELLPYVKDSKLITTMKVDVFDLMEVSRWLGDQIKYRAENGFYDSDDAESFFIDLEVQCVFHAQFHIKSLRSLIEDALGKFPNEE
ncbi:MAG: hypothetical protein U0975_08440 [Erythrobacter sp.]|nr:hypothetical protein [Erythrobacter sp.]MDZ4272684.1 hypothetical protein [Erythrobacter sp.]